MFNLYCVWILDVDMTHCAFSLSEAVSRTPRKASKTLPASMIRASRTCLACMTRTTL